MLSRLPRSRSHSTATQLAVVPYLSWWSARLRLASFAPCRPRNWYPVHAVARRQAPLPVRLFSPRSSRRRVPAHPYSVAGTDRPIRDRSPTTPVVEPAKARTGWLDHRCAIIHGYCSFSSGFPHHSRSGFQDIILHVRQWHEPPQNGRVRRNELSFKQVEHFIPIIAPPKFQRCHFHPSTNMTTKALRRGIIQVVCHIGN